MSRIDKALARAAAVAVDRKSGPLAAAVQTATDDERRLEEARALLERCNSGFSSFIHGRKMARVKRDKLRADINDWLLGIKPKR